MVLRDGYIGDCKLMTPAKLERVASLMYGSTWQTYLAEALGVDRTTVYRWYTSQFAIPKEIEGKLLLLAKEHNKKITTFLKDY